MILHRFNTHSLRSPPFHHAKPDPNHPIEPDCHVLALIKGGTEAVFRRYAPISQDSHVGARLIAWSPTWPDIIMTEDNKISGVGVELLRKLV